MWRSSPFTSLSLRFALYQNSHPMRGSQVISNLLANEKVRFLIIGGVNTVVGYLLFAFFYWILGHEQYLLAYIVSYVFALFSGFALQRVIVFKVKGQLLLDFFRYTIVQLGSFGVNLVLLPLLVEVFLVTPLLAQAIALFITVVGSYFAHRYFSFHRKTKAETGHEND